MILITGASRGIGKFLFKKFTDKNETVFGTYMNTEPEEEYLDLFCRVSIEDIDSVDRWIKSIVNLNKIILINCAGINYNCFCHKSDINLWKKVIDVNLIGTYNVIKTILPHMRKDNYGRIINLSSIVAQAGVPGTSAYAASKSGLWGLTRVIAKENASKGITINNLNLGYFNIGIIEQVPEEFQSELKEKIPTHKFGDPINIYNSITNLINSPYINGTSIDINGALY
jgi:acetoacetyl-CoA reductase/3-oxoacyl-[acyl-carrier protein] reductase